MVGTIILYRTYAYFEEKKEFNVLKGQIPSHWYDANILSIKVGDEEVEAVPERGMYKVITDCGSTNATWDYNSWTLNLNNIRENSKCNLTFLENGISEEEYQYYLGIGKAYRRNTYRGKILTDTYTLDQIYAMISDGTFSDIYVGDVIKAGGKDWLVADIDNYLHSGDQELTKHHLTIIPALPLAYSAMNETMTTEGAYANSDMVKGKDPENTYSKVTYTLVDALAEVESAFDSSHIIEYRTPLANSMDAEASSSAYVGWKGTSSSRAIYYRKIDLMDEINVFGSSIASSSYYDTGLDTRQYALFQLKPEYVNSYGSTRFYTWLKDVAFKNNFAAVGQYGASYSDAANQGEYMGVRPRFLIG